jgi:hypothetical protein
MALVAGICTVMVSTTAFAQDPPWRHEIRRLDVPGAPDKQVVVELNESRLRPHRRPSGSPMKPVSLQTSAALQTTWTAVREE